jgi:hypothetical protein
LGLALSASALNHPAADGCAASSVLRGISGVSTNWCLRHASKAGLMKIVDPSIR